MKNLVVVRHGHQDKYDLSNIGKDMMRRVAEGLKGRFPTSSFHIVCADVSHVRQSATILTELLGCESAKPIELLNYVTFKRIEEWLPFIKSLQQEGENCDVLVIVARTGIHLSLGYWLDTPTKQYGVKMREDRSKPSRMSDAWDAWGCGYILDYEADTCEQFTDGKWGGLTVV